MNSQDTSFNATFELFNKLEKNIEEITHLVKNDDITTIEKLINDNPETYHELLFAVLEHSIKENKIDIMTYALSKDFTIEPSVSFLIEEALKHAFEYGHNDIISFIVQNTYRDNKEDNRYRPHQKNQDSKNFFMTKYTQKNDIQIFQQGFNLSLKTKNYSLSKIILNYSEELITIKNLIQIATTNNVELFDYYLNIISNINANLEHKNINEQTIATPNLNDLNPKLKFNWPQNPELDNMVISVMAQYNANDIIKYVLSKQLKNNNFTNHFAATKFKDFAQQYIDSFILSESLHNELPKNNQPISKVKI